MIIIVAIFAVIVVSILARFLIDAILPEQCSCDVCPESLAPGLDTKDPID